jgi:hypothetical protein
MDSESGKKGIRIRVQEGKMTHKNKSGKIFYKRKGSGKLQIYRTKTFSGSGTAI